MASHANSIYDTRIVEEIDIIYNVKGRLSSLASKDEEWAYILSRYNIIEKIIIDIYRISLIIGRKLNNKIFDLIKKLDKNVRYQDKKMAVDTLDKLEDMLGSSLPVYTALKYLFASFITIISVLIILVDLIYINVNQSINVLLVDSVSIGLALSALLQPVSRYSFVLVSVAVLVGFLPAVVFGGADMVLLSYFVSISIFLYLFSIIINIVKKSI